MLTPPIGKPEKWMLLMPDWKLNVREFLNDASHKAQKSVNLLDDSLLVSVLTQCTRQKPLIGNTRSGGLLSGLGDSVRMMTLDLAMKIASGKPMQTSLVVLLMSSVIL